MPSSAQVPAEAVVAAVKCWREDASRDGLSGLPVDLKFQRALEAAYPHLLAAFKERLLSDEVVREITKQIVEGSDGEVISLPYAAVRNALADFSTTKEGTDG